MKLLFLLVFLTSCAYFPEQRTHFAQMSRDDRGFLEPHRDFPVVMGDTGSWGYSEEVRRLRTPASTEESQEYELEQALKWELAELESIQSKEAFATYEKYSHHFTTISERIYYLKLPYHERYSYLESRGLISSGLSTFQVTLGMSKTDVLSVLGRPQRVDIAGNPSFENERWLYAEQGSPKYIYFESGKVGGWE